MLLNMPTPRYLYHKAFTLSSFALSERIDVEVEKRDTGSITSKRYFLLGCFIQLMVPLHSFAIPTQKKIENFWNVLHAFGIRV